MPDILHNVLEILAGQLNSSSRSPLACSSLFKKLEIVRMDLTVPKYLAEFVPAGG